MLMGVYTAVIVIHDVFLFSCSFVLCFGFATSRLCQDPAVH